ncbi:YbaB/EbfC family nucleoid-associated protein [Actinophytocola sp. KF-1]
MFSSFENEMTAAMRELRDKQGEIAAALGKLHEATATATSKDRMLKATVDGQGKLTELAFNGTRWREMAPKELGAKIVEVVGQAQEQAALRTAELMGGLVPAGFDLEQLRTVGPDLESMIDDAIADVGRWSK